MIVAERREGSLREEAPDARSSYAPMWRSLDRNVPLGVKLALPVIAVTVAGTMLFGFLLAQQARRSIDDSYVASASATAQASANAFYNTISDPTVVDEYLKDIAGAQPNVMGIWIVNTVYPGAPVVASSNSGDLGMLGLLTTREIETVQAGSPLEARSTIGGTPVLETELPVKGNVFAVIIRTSLQAESAAFSSTLLWGAVAAAGVCILEVTALMAFLEAAVLGRIRRVRNTVDEFGRGGQHARLSEGYEPEGRDALFNLARRVDQKLVELGERERAGTVVSELGLLALQGMQPAELTSKALDITRQAADLDRCFLVKKGGDGSIVDSFEGSGGKSAEAMLPIWLGALVRAAAQSRRPILADGLGQDSRFWEADAEAQAMAAAAFVPLAGNPEPIGVMVGVARAGGHISTVGISLMEAVATALGESLQRNEAEKARHESEVKSKALATVSHEMRNPLNAMLGFSNLLLSGAAGPLNEKQESYVRRVDDASKHLLRLVTDYLDLARVMAGSLPMQPESVPVAPEVESVLAMLGPTAVAKDVVLRSQVAPDAVAHVDRLRLRQVLTNLVSNGIRFTPARGYVRIEVAGGSNGVRISVIDTGVGIAADRQHLVFTEFAQLAEGRDGGTGLGLALTKRFVEAMGGFIRFTSSEGAGTIFDVWLPGDRTPKSVGGAGTSAAGAGTAA